MGGSTNKLYAERNLETHLISVPAAQRRSGEVRYLYPLVPSSKGGYRLPVSSYIQVVLNQGSTRVTYIHQLLQNGAPGKYLGDFRPPAYVNVAGPTREPRSLYFTLLHDTGS